VCPQQATLVCVTNTRTHAHPHLYLALAKHTDVPFGSPQAMQLTLTSVFYNINNVTDATATTTIVGTTTQKNRGVRTCESMMAVVGVVCGLLLI
jgi:hypothetical protein